MHETRERREREKERERERERRLRDSVRAFRMARYPALHPLLGGRHYF